MLPQEAPVMFKLFLALPLLTSLAAAQSLRTVDNPSGGHVTYGIFDQDSTKQAAMVDMLRKVHANFGDKPQIGQFFESKQGETVGTFFTVTAKKQNNKPVAGMILVTMPNGLKPSAACLYDDASRFSSTRPALMKLLIASVTGNSSSDAGGSDQPSVSRAHVSGRPGPVGQLHRVVAPDNSASMQVPEGWRVKNGSGGGQLAVEGPRGESMALGIVNGNIYDPTNPQARTMIQYLSRGSAPYSVCPYSRDLVAIYKCVSQQQRQRMRMSPIASFKVNNYQNIGASQYLQQNAVVDADIDFGDGKGVMRANIQLGTMTVGNQYSLFVGQVNVPESIADQEWSTVMAAAKTYSQNQGVVQGQINVQLDNQRATFDAQQERHRAQVAQGDASTAAFNAHNDQLDRQSKSFQNLTLDQSVLEDTHENARGTITNNTADAYVKANPDRYRIVPQQDWIKGQDY